jgi:hypothetical protein
MIIYVNTDTCQYHLNQIGIESTKNLDIFTQYVGLKIAMFHIPFPWDQGHGEIFESQLHKIKDHCDQIVIIGSELHETTVNFILKNQQKNINYFICGSIEGIRFKQWMDWFVISTYFYKQNPILDQLSPYASKPKIFDILLGGARPHRTKIYDYILKNNLNDRVIMTYMRNSSKPLQQLTTSDWIWPEGLNIPEKDITWTVTPISYQGRSMSLSTVVPINIYNDTAYSIVAETNYFNHFNFYTEKIVKPILAERLFLVFSGVHYLRNLRNLGFKTFNGIVDESYDDVEDTELRFQMIFVQMQYLFNQPQEKILEQIRPITEHNKHVMLETDWYGNFSKELRAVLLDQQVQN